MDAFAINKAAEQGITLANVEVKTITDAYDKLRPKLKPNSGALAILVIKADDYKQFINDEDIKNWLVHSAPKDQQLGIVGYINKVMVFSDALLPEDNRIIDNSMFFVLSK